MTIDRIPANLALALTTQPFIRSISLRDVALNGCRFEVITISTCVQAFSERLFRHFGITRPSRIAVSIKRRQAEYLAGRLALRVALARIGYIGLPQIPSGPAREPVLPDGFKGSISHCADFAVAIACPAARCRGVGVDVERIARGDALEALERMVLSDVERRRCQAEISCPTATLMSIVFSAKESLYKAAYGTVKSFFGFDAAQFLEYTGMLVRLELTTTVDVSLPAGLVVEVAVEDLGAGRIMTALLLPTS